MQPDPSSSPSTIVSLLQQLRDEGFTLLRQEVALAKAELSEKLSHKASQAARVAIGGMIAYAGVIVLLLGAGDLLAFALQRTGVSPEIATWLGRSLIGLVIAIIGYAMLARARHALAAESIVPEQTLASLREDKAWGQAKLHHSHEAST